MSKIELLNASCADQTVDAVVNAANTGLIQGGGVCGFIFRDAGVEKMTKACTAIGHCDEGSAVITPGFDLPAKYVIHAVGPRYVDGNHEEPKLLYSAYEHALLLAEEYGLKSIGFPLISAGIFGYPVEEAWEIAIRACNDFLSDNPDRDIDIVFAVIDDRIKKIGEDQLNR